jgi:hypothetical protein
MSKTLFLFILLILSGICCQAQSGFNPGFIVFNNGNRIDGLINISKYNICKLKINEKDEPKEYKLEQIDYVKLNDGSLFKSIEVTFADKQPKLMIVEVLVQGELSLFYVDKYFFVNKKNDKLHQLVEIETDVIGGVRTNKKYLGILAFLMSDCPEIRGAVNRSDLNEKDLTKLAVKYNQCRGEEYTESKSSLPFSQLKFGATLGFLFKNHNLLEVKRVKSYPNGEYAGIVPSAGVKMELSFPRTTKNFYIKASPNFQFTKINRTSFQGSTTDGSQYDVKLSYGLLSLPIGIKYNFNFQNEIFYANIGFAYNIFFAKKMAAEKGLISESNIFLSSIDLPFELAPLNFWFGLGYQIKSIFDHQGSIELKYEWSDHYYQSTSNNYNQLLSATESFTLMFGILF